MRINFKVFSKIAAVGFLLLMGAKILLPNMESFVVISALVGIGMAAVYLSVCDFQGDIKNSKN